MSIVRTILSRSFIYVALALALKLSVTRYVVFGGLDAWGLLVGEASFVLLVVTLLDVRREPSIRRLLVTDAVWSLLLVAVVMYHAQFGRVPSVRALGWATQLGGVRESVAALLRLELVLFFADIPVFWAVWKFRPEFIRPVLRGRGRRIAMWIAVLGMLGNVVAGLAAPAPDVTIASQRRGLVNAQLLEIVHSTYTTQVRIDASDPGSVAAAIAQVGGEPVATAPVLQPGVAAGRHVILVLVESLQSMAVGLEVGGQAVTPNLDRLAADGVSFPNTYSQVGPGNTSDCEYLMSSSAYPSPTEPTSEKYGGQAIPGLVRTLGEAGYATLTFHANEVTFWNRDELYPALGYTEVYAEDFFEGAQTVGLGPSDQYLFATAAPVLADLDAGGRPFVASFVTLTGHHPFNLPDSLVQLELPEAYRGTLVGHYLESMHYTDQALGEFFEALRVSGVYDNSVIVIVGDHFGLQQSQMSAQDLALAEEILGRPYNDADRFNVPLVIAVPGEGQGVSLERPTGQVDIAPTVLGLLGYDVSGLPLFGRDALATEAGLLGFRYYAPNGTFADDQVFALPAGDGGYDVYDARTQEPLDQEPDGLDERSRRATELQTLSDTYLDALPVR